MPRPTLALRARRAGLVLGGAVLGAAALLAAAAGPAAAAAVSESAVHHYAMNASTAEPAPGVPGRDAAVLDPATAAFESSAPMREPAAPLLAPPSLHLLNGAESGEARFETMPSFVPAPRVQRSSLGGAASIGWRATRDPWLAAGLTIAGPAALAVPALLGVWAPVAASPLALAAGHLYAGDAGRGALVGLGGVGVMGAGAAAGYGLGTWLGAPLQGAMLAGGGVGLGAYTAWAASDAFRAAGAVGLVEVVTVSKR